jgi:hypothetical protein
MILNSGTREDLKAAVSSLLSGLEDKSKPARTCSKRSRRGGSLP